MISHTFLEYYAGALKNRNEKIIFSVSYLLWSILLLSSHCVLHHSHLQTRFPTLDSKLADAELNSATGMQMLQW